MLIPVIYFDGFPGKVKSEDLDILIRRRVIAVFRRSKEWVKVSNCSFRGTGGTYRGPDRRRV
jgi:hypothetical protein